MIPTPLETPAGVKLAPIKSVAELRKRRRVRAWKLGKEWEWLGRLPASFDMLISGIAGGGKSSMATMMAAQMASAADDSVLYVSTEEGTGDALLARLERLEVRSPLVLISSATSWQELSHDIEQTTPAAVFLDSLTYSQVTERQLVSLRETLDVPLIVTAHITKDNKVAGSASLAHWVDIAVDVTAGVARTRKNRFGALAEYRIFGGDPAGVPDE